MGKGDRYRPVDTEKYAENYERIFGDECQETATSNENCNGNGTRDTEEDEC